MTPPVVTLFGKYGAGARYIGPRVAKALGVEWMDHAFSAADIESAIYPGGGKAGDQGSALARFLSRFASGATVLDDRSIPLAQAEKRGQPMSEPRDCGNHPQSVRPASRLT